MSDLSKEDTNALIQSYQSTSKALRTRAIIMGVLFLIILGLQHSKQVNAEKYKTLNHAIFLLQDLTESGDLKKAIDSVEFASGFLDYYFVGNNILQEQELKRLKFELAKSNYQDYTPLYDRITDYEKQQKELGTESGDYQISVLGINTSFSDWLYFTPVILLLLFHDMTVTIFYRKSLREKLAAANVENWKLGSELFEAEHRTNENPTQRFLRGITTIFVIALLFLPLIPAFIGAISYMEESNAEKFNGLMAAMQWICPMIMTIELILIYYTENLLWMRSIFNYVNRSITSRPSISAIIFSWVYAILTVTFFITTSYYFLDYGHTEETFELSFFLMLIFTTSVLPISLILLRHYSGNYWLRGLRIIGRCLMGGWIYAFILTVNRPYEYSGFYEGGFMQMSFIILGFAVAFAGGFIWVFKNKSDKLHNENPMGAQKNEG